MGKKKSPRNIVLMEAFDVDGGVVERFRIPYDDFYEEGVAVVDSEDYRLRKKIRRLTGDIYNSRGQLQQHFENTYATDGSYIGHRIEFADGTIVEG